MSDAKVVSVMYEEGANDVQCLSTVILWETKCSFISVFPKTSASLHQFTAPWHIMIIELTIPAASRVHAYQHVASQSARFQLGPWSPAYGEVAGMYRGGRVGRQTHIQARWSLSWNQNLRQAPKLLTHPFPSINLYLAVHSLDWHS